MLCHFFSMANKSKRQRSVISLHTPKNFPYLFFSLHNITTIITWTSHSFNSASQFFSFPHHKCGYIICEACVMIPCIIFCDPKIFLWNSIADLLKWYMNHFVLYLGTNEGCSYHIVNVYRKYFVNCQYHVLWVACLDLIDWFVEVLYYWGVFDCRLYKTESE